MFFRKQSRAKNSPQKSTSRETIKQVIVVNQALELPKGKCSAQVAHAAVAAFLNATAEVKSQWLNAGMPKVVLKTRDPEELHRLREMAKRRGIAAALIADAGKTVVAAGTQTCIGLGPAEADVLDELTGDLKLL